MEQLAERVLRPRERGAPAVRDDTPKPPPRVEDEAGDPGTTLLATVSAAMLSVVALAWLVGAVDRWWILVPVVAVALVLTAGVLTVVVRLLDDD